MATSSRCSTVWPGGTDWVRSHPTKIASITTTAHRNAAHTRAMTRALMHAPRNRAAAAPVPGDCLNVSTVMPCGCVPGAGVAADSRASVCAGIAASVPAMLPTVLQGALGAWGAVLAAADLRRDAAIKEADVVQALVKSGRGWLPVRLAVPVHVARIVEGCLNTRVGPAHMIMPRVLSRPHVVGVMRWYLGQ